MEKPAVVFSEQGWKLFLEFLNGMKQNEESSASEVDSFVRDYYNRQSPTDIELDLKMNEIANFVEKLLSESEGPMHNREIGKALRAEGYSYTNKGIPPVMRGVMQRKPQIKKLDKGLYTHG